LYKDLGEQIDYWMGEYKTNKNDLRDLIAKDTDVIVILKNKKYSTCISMLGVLNKWDLSIKKVKLFIILEYFRK
jgi:hypothetical protein